MNSILYYEKKLIKKPIYVGRYFIMFQIQYNICAALKKSKSN